MILRDILKYGWHAKSVDVHLVLTLVLAVFYSVGALDLLIFF